MAVHKTGRRGAGRRRSLTKSQIETIESRVLLSGTWTALSHTAPGSVGTMLLLQNGTVMTTLNGGGAGSDWGLLTPSATGSYAAGTWTKLANASYTRLYDASQVLPDGRVFVAGGEYGSGAATGETYNPLTNTWSTLPSQSYGSFIDANSIMLPNGNVLIAPVAPNPSGYTTIFHPSTNTWSQGPKLYRGGSADECSWVKLADDSVIMTDGNGTSERYIPSTNQWINDGAVPVSLFDGLGEEGAGIRLSDGRAFFIGATGHTAIYTPTGTTAPGSWVAGPNVPNTLGTDDAPLAMLPDGTVLCCAGPSGTYGGPTTFFIYDPVANAFNAVSGAPSIGGAPFVSRMLDLPNGQVLYTSGGSQLYVYSPGTSPLAIAQPSITSIINNPDGSLTLTGTGLNGIDAGAAYGDDAQMDSNYPIISLTSGTNVYYARSYNWSSTSIATGSLAETVNFTLPLGIPPGTYSVATSANGVSSAPVSLTISTTANNLAPTIATPAAASPSPASGTTTALSVLGADDAGESNLVYTWTTTSVPSGASLPSFSINGTNAAKNSTVTFHHAGSYTFDVIVTDSGGLSTSSTVSVTVNQVVSSITLTPAVGNLSSNGTEQLTAQALDQFGIAMATQPAFTWSMASGGGTVSTTGRYTAPAFGTLATVKAAYSTFSATAQIGVVPTPWSNVDVGSPGLTGLGYQAASGAYTIEGSGSDIWNASDAFHFVYQSLSGDGVITARVASQQNTNASAKSGVMIRNSLSAGDQYVLMATTPGSGVTLQDRATSGGNAVQTAVTSGLTAPYWVRLVRSGNTFIAYRSADGVNWIGEGSVTIAMGTTVDVGLAVCAHNNSALNTSTFDNVSVVATPSNFGFETPSYGTGASTDYAYDPAGASWTFAGTSGIAANGSSITAGNPSAPQGTQVGFLEATGSSILQSVTMTAGAHAITFSAAQAAANLSPEDFEVLVDGNVAGTFKPVGTSYATYATKSITFTAGAHTIGFDALDSAGGDNIALIDNVNIKTPSAVALALASGANPSTLTQPLTFTATVGVGVANGGKVALEDASNNNAVVATGTLANGSATLNVAAGTFAIGTHDLIAVYGGDANFAASQSAAFVQTVHPDALPSYITASSGSVYSYNSITGALSLSSGTLTFTADNTAAPLINLTASGSASGVFFNTSEHLAGLTLSGGAQATVLSLGSARTHSNHNVLVIGALGSANDPTFWIDAASKLDLSDNDLIVHTGSSDQGNGVPNQLGVAETNELANVQALAALGRNVAAGGVLNGTWTGNGLTSSSAASADAAAGFEQNVLAVVQNSDQVLGKLPAWIVGSFSEPLGSNDILVKYTYNGDAALEGFVGPDSVTIVNGFYDGGKSTQNDWAFGNFTGNGAVDDNDITILNGVYGLGTGGSNGPQL